MYFGGDGDRHDVPDDFYAPMEVTVADDVCDEEGGTITLWGYESCELAAERLAADVVLDDATVRICDAATAARGRYRVLVVARTVRAFPETCQGSDPSWRELTVSPCARMSERRRRTSPFAAQLALAITP